MAEGRCGHAARGRRYRGVDDRVFVLNCVVDLEAIREPDSSVLDLHTDGLLASVAARCRQRRADAVHARECQGSLVTIEYPELQIPFANAYLAALVDKTVSRRRRSRIADCDEDAASFWRLDLSRDPHGRRWEGLEADPDARRGCSPSRQA